MVTRKRTGGPGLLQRMDTSHGLVGDGPDRKIVERMARDYSVSDLTDFRGRVEGAEKYQLMSSAHAVLMTSRRETFGLVAIESLAAGVPIVAFEVGPLREVVGGAAGARLIRPWDLDAFAQEVLRFVDDRELRETVSRLIAARGRDTPLVGRPAKGLDTEGEPHGAHTPRR